MLRMAVIGSLVLVNIFVWMSPAERFMSSAMGVFDPAPRVERAEHFVVAGDLPAAFKEYQALVAAHPENGAYRYAFGIFCYINSKGLRKAAGLTSPEIFAVIQQELYAARELSANDYDLAQEYALILMDDDMLRAGATRAQATEAWGRVLELLEARHQREPEWTLYATKAAQINVQLARVASRFGDVAAAEESIRTALAIAPDFRVPENFIERNITLLQ